MLWGDIIISGGDSVISGGDSVIISGTGDSIIISGGGDLLILIIAMRSNDSVHDKRKDKIGLG